MSSLKSMAQQAVMSAGLDGQINSQNDHQSRSSPSLFANGTSISGANTHSINSSVPVSSSTPSMINLLNSNGKTMVMPSMVTSPVSNLTSMTRSVVSPANSSGMHPTEAHIPPSLGVAPLGPVQLPKQCIYQLHMLEAACQHAIHPIDSQRIR